jgi:MinD superfamily P-loop ATPase
MIIAVASGKGGTGKTTVVASLAAVWERPLAVVDLDVEAPNLHLFLRPELTASTAAYMEIPEVDEARCTRCRACVEICQFKAISLLGDVMMTFPEMCHGCGACMAICPENAIRPGRRTLGEILWGRTGKIQFAMGRLKIGEAMSPPLIRCTREKIVQLTAGRPVDIIMDAPPGVSCPAVHAVMDADAIVLVTEPTPFGFYDLTLAVQAFTPLGRRLGVVVNRAGIGNRDVYRFCKRREIPILAEIPFDRDLAATYARGEIIARAHPAIRERFRQLQQSLVNMEDMPHQERSREIRYA